MALRRLAPASWREFDNPGARVLGDTLDEATALYLGHSRAPSRKANELDNRGSIFYVTLYWAQALAKQSTDPELAIGGYYMPDPLRAGAVMRPSASLNGVIDRI